jgi:hypothetical protein
MTLRAFLLAVLAFATPAFADPIRPFDRAHAVSFQIETGIGKCSATAVGPHTILTADHCVVNDGLMMLDIGDGNVVEVVSIVSDDKDHVLIRVKHRFKAWAYVRRSPLRMGEAVHYFGNPGEMTDILRVGRLIGLEDVMLPHPDTMQPWPQKDVQVYDFQAGGGDSGSGVFDQRGLLVAVVSATYSDRIRVALCLPLAFTREQWAEAAK